MNTNIRGLMAACGVVLLAGCSATLSEGEYSNIQAVIGGSPAAKRSAISECAARQRTRPLAEKKETAMLFNISMASYPTTYCNRLWNAVANGRITYADYRKLSNSTADNSKVIRIMQGR